MYLAEVATVAEESWPVGEDPKLTCVLDGEVRLALHGGGQLVHAQ